MTIKKINHVAIVVHDIDKALPFWRDVLGLELFHVENVPEQDVTVAFLPVGESEVELLEPASEDGSLARYLAKRGAGIHHICLEVDDLEGMLAQLKEKGVQLVNEQPAIGAGGRKMAFIHPRSAGGILVELYE